MLNNGVREVLPFVRYIGQFVDFEFSNIQKADHGEGVVCAATWVMPAAMVPRPWDFPPVPQKSNEPVKSEEPEKPADSTLALLEGQPGAVAAVETNDTTTSTAPAASGLVEEAHQPSPSGATTIPVDTVPTIPVSSTAASA